MNEQELRAMIRESVARHLAQTRHDTSHGEEVIPARDDLARKYGVLPIHPSHDRYGTLPPSSGPCYIEPGVACSHCGFCESHGH